MNWKEYHAMANACEMISSNCIECTTTDGYDDVDVECLLTDALEKQRRIWKEQIEAYEYRMCGLRNLNGSSVVAHDIVIMGNTLTCTINIYIDGELERKYRECEYYLESDIFK